MNYSNMTNEEKERYLLMESYMSKDLKALTGYKSKTSISKLLQTCREHDGAIPGRPYAITSDSYWKARGSDRRQELINVEIALGKYEELRYPQIQNT